jgi:hypothetical protein
MEMAASRPVKRGRRGRLQHLQQRLGILDRTSAIEDDGAAMVSA